MKVTGFPPALDFLSVDIDGLDSEIFENLDIRPRVICIEVYAGFRPDSDELLPGPVAVKIIGRPFGVVMRIARAKGYAFVCNSVNAFFMHEDIVQRYALRVVAPADAHSSFLGHLQPATRS